MIIWSFAPDELIQAVIAVTEGQVYLQPALAQPPCNR
jgi:hypothetical protein